MLRELDSQAFSSQSGQTLIETMAGLFMLVMGVTAAVGLAIYAFSASDNITKQIVAIGLAREGAEAVKNMRDTNWLRQGNTDLNCYNFQTGASSPDYPDPAGGARCYRNWLTQVYNIDPPSGDTATYLVRSTPLAAEEWEIVQAVANFGLNRIDVSNISAMDDPAFTTLYFHPASPVAHGNSDYYRKITIVQERPNAAFTQTNFERVKVISQVWWRGRNCPENRANIGYPAQEKCSVTLETYLTNWKNY